MSLLSTLTEQWHPETHTFHLPFGEWGITPYDVYMQFGLRYDEGSIPFEEDLLVPSDDDWMSLLWMIPDSLDLFGHRFRLLWLSSNFARRIPETEVTAIVKARALIVYTMGAMIFCHGNELVSSHLLSLVADITFPTPYNWNAALLAHLYEGLDKSSRYIRRSLTGFNLIIEFRTRSYLRSDAALLLRLRRLFKLYSSATSWKIFRQRSDILERGFSGS
ncbi:protein MAIN-LIKE 1-like [Magnolia sinica]|uniref:protein MAIN-LIKE 1-like n=1 Tax=Magnolia sinica TaxID=86752 RepID=UPI00265A4922|nr:protein MAIN-LIKE 1-like [Magnolia sinica]